MDDLLLEQKRFEHSQALDETLKSIIQQLQVMPAVLKVILFGSYAQGRKDLFTDLDLIIVMESQDDFITRNAKIYQQLDPKVDLDILVYTPGEFEYMSKRGFVHNALITGKVIYEK